ncbi:hypothetical protein BC829DRAFT_385098 [Chytridium lagenaria]|nr:hypothetical protein BC829DRAFT_385098 [Chytridium lagenaria]
MTRVLLSLVFFNPTLFDPLFVFFQSLTPCTFSLRCMMFFGVFGVSLLAFWGVGEMFVCYLGLAAGQSFSTFI